MPTDTSLDGKTALVTGASAGIGAETARVLAREGATVAVTARREERLQELAATLEADFDATVEVLPADVGVESAVEAMVADAADALGGLDVVVNNAGIGAPGPLEEVTTEDYRTLMAVNVDGMFFTTRAAVPHLRDSEGHLVFVGSFAGQYPRPNAPVYAASKWWTRGFALSLAGQLGSDGIGVTVVNPTEVRTEFGDNYRGESQAERFEPGSVTEPAAIAEAVAYAARQSPPNAAAEIDLYRRDKFSHF